MRQRIPLTRFLLPCMLAAGFILGTQAQAPQDQKVPKIDVPTDLDESAPGPGRYDRVDQLAALLKLTPQQKVKVKPLVDAETKQMQALRGQKLTREERRKKFDALRDDTYGKIKPLLTPEQLARWDHVRGFKPTLPKPGTVATNPPTIVPPTEAPPTNR